MHRIAILLGHLGIIVNFRFHGVLCILNDPIVHVVNSRVCEGYDLGTLRCFMLL